MNCIIVSRHEGAIEFIRTEAGLGADVPVMASVTEADVKGACVYGNLPMRLASLCAMYYAVEFVGTPPRGQEYGADDMLDAGAYLQRYIVCTPEQFGKRALEYCGAGDE